MIDKLIKLNIEIEGLLRVVKERDDETAKEMLQLKFDEFSLLFCNEFSEYPMIHEDATETVSTQIQAQEPKPVTALQPVEATESEKTIETVPEPSSVHSAASEPSPAQVAEDVSEEVSETAPVQPASRKKGPDFTHAFTVNDKYKFILSIFHGDTQLYADTLARLSEMDSLDDAFDYLYNNLTLNDEDECVAEFVSIISSHFNSLT